jgi:hypothetical protein
MFASNYCVFCCRCCCEQARCALPTLFDCNYAYTLGRGAVALAARQYSGYCVTVSNLKANTAAARWTGLVARGYARGRLHCVADLMSPPLCVCCPLSRLQPLSLLRSTPPPPRQRPPALLLATFAVAARRRWLTCAQGPVSAWLPGGAPLTAMLASAGDGEDDLRTSVAAAAAAQAAAAAGDTAAGAARAGAPLRVPQAQVDVAGPVYHAFAAALADRLGDKHCNPGPTQFQGPGSLDVPVTLRLSRLDYLGQLRELEELSLRLRELCRPGASPRVVALAVAQMRTAADVLALVRSRDM